MRKKRLVWCLMVLAYFTLAWQPALGGGGGPDLGTKLPSFTLAVPGTQEELAYLGLKERAPFFLSDVNAKVIVIEVINAL